MAEYKIKDIESLTGIKAHTIRIWEKRYNLLTPERTGTQIRTYSDSELLKLLNVALLNKRGIKISHIARMSEQEITQKVSELVHKGNNDSWIEKLIMALIRMDEVLLRSTLKQLIDEHGVSETYVKYIVGFMDRIGIMWQIGSITPAQEHFISNLIRQQLISSIEQLPIPETDQPAVLLFLPEHEWHELGLLLYQYHLRSKGIPTIYLGQALPYSSLLETIRLLQPKLLVTSWLTSVETSFIKQYFERFVNDVPDCTIAAAGFQVLHYEEEIRRFIKPFHSLEQLDTLLMHDF